MNDWDDVIKRLVDEAPPLSMEQRVRLALMLAKPMGLPAPQAAAPPRQPNEVMTVVEAAEHLNVGRSKVYELIRSGQLRSVLIGRRRLIRYADLQSYISRL